MTLIVCCLHSDHEERARGVSAALAVFQSHKRTPEYCSAELDKLANGEDYDAPAVQTWHEAEWAAIRACCDGWVKAPESAHIEIVD